MEVKKVNFPELEAGEKGAKLGGKALGDIPVQVNVELGKAKMSLREVLDLSEGSIIELDRLAGEPLDLKVGGQLIAQGEVVAIDDYYGLRITNVLIK
ncbi:MAG: flagellar motor switch protein FliN [Candidatus Margulisbacteria bacterium]|nr:flagellar motor switch protein FliN [Candidatus Margulisiibacteriota bacterium]MBU1021181.1 flagellar motor switch protein FliN [Candidatus Margulisiibacteriota bacterium]MBU1729787.1 flagellar motor switch protein FliN [Candidatus Margulisiibacteriota bacterium]MBU1955288.1 flagellar motor switch protein FliN [Candidatus Margulisiibacteriota bacterium]